METVPVMWRNAAALLLLACLFGPAQGSVSEPLFPLEPANTSSPRSTLLNLMDNLRAAQRLFVAASQEHEASPGLTMSDSVREQQEQIRLLLKRAVGSLDLSELPRATRQFLRIEAAIQIKEILDRVPFPPLESIPDEAMVEAQGINRWRIPHTGIHIERIEEGPRRGEFLIDTEAVSNAGAMYREIRHLPYLRSDTAGAYTRFVISPGRLLTPKWLMWVDDLPDWLLAIYFGKALWQWIALVLTLLLVVLAATLVSYWLRRFREPESRFVRVLRRMAVPATALIGLRLAEYFLIWQVNFTSYFLVALLKGLFIPITLLGAYLCYLLTLLVTEAIISAPRIETASLDANMLRMIAGLVGGGIGLAVIFHGANDLGVPVVPLVASLGVGGLAVALAARPTIENLIGGIILYIDRPVSVGDFCSFGDHMGTVEAIGMRSIQLRARDRTIITVPNASFADMEIINWARCDMMLIQTTIGVRYETRIDQVRYLLARLREMCLAHPRIDNGTVRIRFGGYGDSSQDIGIRVFALTHDWNEFFAIQEDILLRVGEIVEQAGTGFAFPSQTVYMRRDDGIDEALGNEAVDTVEDWRRKGRLPFPNMVQAEREKLIDTLDYPPKGSPDAACTEQAEQQTAEPLSADETPEEPDERNEDSPGKSEHP